MSYCTKTHVEYAIGQGLSSSTPVQEGLVKLPTIGSNLDSAITDDEVNQFIAWTAQEIDAFISEMYRTPLKEQATGEWYLDVDIDEYNSSVVLSTAHNLLPGDEIIIVSSTHTPTIKETHTVATVVDRYTVTTVDAVATVMPAGIETRVIRIGYPSAITLANARMAAANIYDKYYAAQTGPDMSDYGNRLRSLGLGLLESVLNGVVILHGQDRIGHRFASPYLLERYQLIKRDGNDHREIKDPGK